MIITKVEAIMLRPPGAMNVKIADGSQDGLLIRITADNGLVGFGEVDSLPMAVKAVIDAPASHSNASGLGGLIVGQDARNIRSLWQRMFEGSIYFGRRGVVLHAISGIEIALWDLFGKSLNLPIHALLGGAKRKSVKAYASTLMPDTPDQVRSVVAAQKAAGFRAIKLGWGPLGRSPDLDVALVAAAREAGGDAFDIMIDMGMGWRSARVAIETARRMEEYRPYWIEEPFWPDEYAKYKALAEAISTPVAGGEEETTLMDFERLAEQGGAEILQPDVTRAGGILECLRIAEYAKRSGKRCVLHAWSTGIIKAATLHTLSVMDEAEYMEYCVQTTELNQRLVNQTFPVVDGFVAVPDGPGLGIEIDAKALEEFTVRS